MKFTYDEYESILWNLKEHFNLSLLQDADHKIRDRDRICFIRHDVDLSVDKALEMALIEKENKVRSTYHVFYECPFYSVHDKDTKRKLKEIISLGHEVGIHTNNRLPSEINFEIMGLESALDTQIKSMSFNRPEKDEVFTQFMHYEKDIIIYAYSKKLMEWYVSDSRGEWRVDLKQELKERDSQVLQILIHPFWWDDDITTPQTKLKDFIKHRFYKEKRQLEQHKGLGS